MKSQSIILRKSLAVILGLCFLSVLILVSLTFWRPKTDALQESRVIQKSKTTIWNALYHKKYYVASRPEISKVIFYDTILPRWTEYYGSQDSQNNKTLKAIPNYRLDYLTWSNRYEQVIAYQIYLDSIDTEHTKVTIREHSLYYNTWANIYFRLLKPKATIDYEYLKIINTMRHIDSMHLVIH